MLAVIHEKSRVRKFNNLSLCQCIFLLICFFLLRLVFVFFINFQVLFIYFDSSNRLRKKIPKFGIETTSQIFIIHRWTLLMSQHDQIDHEITCKLGLRKK